MGEVKKGQREGEIEKKEKKRKYGRVERGLKRKEGREKK